MHGELVAAIRLRRRPGILIDHQLVDRHRAFGEQDDPDVKPTPGGHLQAHVVEQPADVRDGDGPVPLAPRPYPAGQRQQAAQRVPAQPTSNAQVGRARCRVLDDRSGEAVAAWPTDAVGFVAVGLAWLRFQAGWPCGPMCGGRGRCGSR